MRRVMIVDDERWIRRGLIGAIPWEELGLELAGEAEDGEDAYHMALSRKPDLLFLDMRMPGLDGRELLRLLSSELPELLTVVVSGYSDFEYTKEAIRHNAFDYLLKPLKREELLGVLGKALAELDRRDGERSRASCDRWQSWLRQTLAGDGADGAGTADAAAPPDGCQAADARLLVALPDRSADGTDRHAVMEGLRQLMRQERPFYFGGQWECVMTKAPGGCGGLVLCLFGGQLDEAGLLRLIPKLQAAMRQLAGVGYSFGIAERAEGFERFPGLYLRTKQALNGRRLAESELIVRADGPAGAQAGVKAAAYPRELEQAVLLHVQLGSGEAALEEFGRFYDAIAQESATVGELQRSAALFVHSLEKQLQASGTSLERLSGKSSLAYTEAIGLKHDAASIKELVAGELLPAVFSANGPSGGRQGEQIVKEIQKLIELHYDRPLSLHQIAESRFLNPDYLSRLFKRTTGSNFVDYLTDYRIGKAIELMKGSAGKNYEIAKRVGYEDYRYFSQIFKKKTGMTIGDYRGSLGLN